MKVLNCGYICWVAMDTEVYISRDVYMESILVYCFHCVLIFLLWGWATMNLPASILRGCLGLLHKLCSTNSTVEQLHKKLEFVEYLFRCSHNSTLFPGAECVELKPFG